MRNRFESRKTLNLPIGGGGFDPNIRSAGDVNQLTSINSVRPAEVSALDAIRGITDEAGDRGNLSGSGKICSACHLK